ARAAAEVLFALLARLLAPTPRAGPQDGPQSRPQSGPQSGPRGGPGPAGYPGAVKLTVIQRLHDNWQDLADLVGVPVFARATFAHGQEPRQLWEWLEIRGRLGELPGALAEIGREDLAELLR